jgi:hypothetical protein
MNELYDYNDKNAIKDKLPQLSEKIKFAQIEIIDIDRDILNVKDIVKYEEAKLMLKISENTELKNQSQRDAQLIIESTEKLSKEKKSLNNLIDKKKRKEAELEYTNTELRINFYYYKDLLGIVSKEVNNE